MPKSTGTSTKQKTVSGAVTTPPTKVEPKERSLLIKVSRDEDGYVVATWNDIQGTGRNLEGALEGVAHHMSERFVALAEVSAHLDENGQTVLRELCAIFAPEKLDEAERAG